MPANKYPNFYENLKEARMRLSDTIVLYDGEPYYIFQITDHKKDGVFRVYMGDLNHPDGFVTHRESIPYADYDGGSTVGNTLDEWLEKNEGKGLIRKMMTSPKFNNFRPFPLGVCNYKGDVIYIERNPTRYTQQGLTQNMLNYSSVSIENKPRMKGANVPDVTEFPFVQTIKGIYPTAQECVNNLQDPEVTNSGAGFHRNFSFVRGPVDLLFFAYKSDVIGYMPNGDLSKVTIHPKFRHTKEVVENLNLFEDIRV